MLYTLIQIILLLSFVGIVVFAVKKIPVLRVLPVNNSEKKVNWQKKVSSFLSYGVGKLNYLSSEIPSRLKLKNLKKEKASKKKKVLSEDFWEKLKR